MLHWRVHMWRTRGTNNYSHRHPDCFASSTLHIYASYWSISPRFQIFWIRSLSNALLMDFRHIISPSPVEIVNEVIIYRCWCIFRYFSPGNCVKYLHLTTFRCSNVTFPVGCANPGTTSLERLGHVSSDWFEYRFRAVWCVSSSSWALMSFTRQHHEYLNQDLTSPSTLRGEGRSNCGGQWKGSLQIEERIPL